MKKIYFYVINKNDKNVKVERIKTRMKRLFRISFDILIASIVPIVSWFLLGIILDRYLINIFSLTYPLQCLMGMIVSIFGVGANISIYKDENKHAADNGIFYGTMISILIFSCIIFNSNKYISFMNMDNTIYRTFCIYSIFQIFCQTVLQLILTKLYYKEQNKKANKISLIFNSINFITLITTAIITRNQLLTSLITGIIIFCMDVIFYIKNIGKLNFKLNVKKCFKYNSVSFSISLLFFIMYLFGFSNVFEYGEKYIIAITFATLVTDMQWDITDAVKTVAKVDIAKKKFIYDEHFKNAIKLYFLLILSVILMTIIAYPFYNPDMKIASVFILLHILDFMLGPFVEIKICFLQLEDSAVKMTLNMIIAYIIRTAISFMPTPFCTIIGQMCSTAYELICTKINFKKYENRDNILEEDLEEHKI